MRFRDTTGLYRWNKENRRAREPKRTGTGTGTVRCPECNQRLPMHLDSCAKLLAYQEALKAAKESSR